MLSIRRCKGITLLELMVVLAITVILTVMAVPNFLTLIQNHRVIGTTENLYYVLQYARSEAIKRNATVYVSFQTGDTWCYGLNTGSSCDCSAANACNLGAYSYTSAGVLSLSVTGFTGNVLQFEGTHGAANAGGSATFTLYGQSKLITINVGLLGNLQMCSTGISGYAAC